MKSAIIDRNPAPGLIFHSDNGANFTSYTFTIYLKEFGIKQSFSRAHNPYDNSVCESFFKTLKQEEKYRKDYRSEKDMLRSITKFMEFYNNDRPHSMIYYKTPNKITIKEKLSKNLEQLDSYNKGIFIFYRNLGKSRKVLLDKSNGIICGKALKHKDF